MHYEKNSFCGTPRASVLRQRGGPDSRRMAAPEGACPTATKSASATAPRSSSATAAGLSPDLQAFSIDYARYNYYNIGFRTGLNVFLDSDVFDYYSIPMQFTWRTGRMVSAWRRSRDEGYEQRPLWQRLLRVLRGEQTRLGQCVPHHAVLDSPLGVRSAYGFHTGHDVRAAEPSAL